MSSAIDIAVTLPEQVVTCPLCSASAALLYKQPQREIWVCRARPCQLQFVHPQMDDLILARAYRQMYYPEMAVERAGETYESTPPELIEQFLDDMKARLGPLSGKRLLDFGCGVGDFSKLARKAGMSVTGIEPDRIARSRASEHADAVFADISELENSAPGTFDFVVMWNAIEHLRRPWEDISRLSQLVPAMGKIIVTTSNVRSVKSRILRHEWDHNPTHFFFFSARSLRATLERAGFGAAEEWRISFRYPHHGPFRRAAHAAAIRVGLQGELVLVASKN